MLPSQAARRQDILLYAFYEGEALSGNSNNRGVDCAIHADEAGHPLEMSLEGRPSLLVLTVTQNLD